MILVINESILVCSLSLLGEGWGEGCERKKLRSCFCS